MACEWPESFGDRDVACNLEEQSLQDSHQAGVLDDQRNDHAWDVYVGASVDFGICPPVDLDMFSLGTLFPPRAKIEAVVRRGGVPDPDVPNDASSTRYWVSTGGVSMDEEKEEQTGKTTVSVNTTPSIAASLMSGTIRRGDSGTSLASADGLAILKDLREGSAATGGGLLSHIRSNWPFCELWSVRARGVLQNDFSLLDLRACCWQSQSDSEEETASCPAQNRSRAGGRHSCPSLKIFWQMCILRFSHVCLPGIELRQRAQEGAQCCRDLL